MHSARSRSMAVRAAAALLLTALFCLPAEGAVASRKYKFERNRPLSLDLSTAEVRADTILFEFPSSVLRFQTANKARVRVANGAGRSVRVGLAIALFDEEGNLVGAGTGGNKGGHLEAGEAEEFSVFFYYVSQNLGSAKTFQITLEIS